MKPSDLLPRLKSWLRAVPGRRGILLRRCVEAVKIWNQGNATMLAAALSFWAAVSISPLLVLVLLALALFLGPEAARGELGQELTELFGPEGGHFVASVLENSQQPRLGSLAGILSGMTLLWGATNLFFQLQAALDIVLGSGQSSRASKRGTLLRRLMSLSMVLVLGFLMLLSLVVGAVITGVSEFLFQGFGILVQWINQIVSLLVIGVLFGAMYRLLPSRTLTWRQVGFGAMITSLLFAVGKLGLGYYLGHASPGSSYGFAGSVIVFLFWCFYSSQIVLFGAALVRAGVDELQVNHTGASTLPDDPNAAANDPAAVVS